MQASRCRERKQAEKSMARLRLASTRTPNVCDAAGHRDGFDDTQPLGGMHWLNENIDRTLADAARIQVLAALTKLAEH